MPETLKQTFVYILSLALITIIFNACISDNKDHYDLDTKVVNTNEFLEDVTDECLLKYEALRASDKAKICEDEECGKQFAICVPAPDIGENTNILCQDEEDNDGDGLIDCDDPNCENVEFCLPEGENTFDKCTDGEDNDDDDLVDCEDIDCAHLEPCLDIPVLPDPTENTNLLCQDGKDNDDDDLVDCEDDSCENVEYCLPDGENTHEKCTDGEDNDDDNLIDCEDIDCAHIDVCLQHEENTFDFCTDNMDNDGDLLVDCEDPDCIQITACLSDTENSYAVCNDGFDNDNDGDIDCEDEECEKFEHCLDIAPDLEDTNEECSDGEDNDGDGDIDCEDDGCAEVKACLPTQDIVISDVTSTADDSDLDGAVNNVINGAQWYKGDAGNDTPAGNPSVTIGGSWGGLYLATGTTGETRDEIDLSEYFLKKLKFDVKSSCDGQDLNLKVQWKSPNPDDQAGAAYNFSKNLEKLIPEGESWDVGDNSWHSYEIDFAEAVGLNSDNSKELVLPFSLWCVDANGANIEVRDLRFEGQADIDCIEISGVPGKEDTIFCDVGA